jgi:hypothetical protein
MSVPDSPILSRSLEVNGLTIHFYIKSVLAKCFTVVAKLRIRVRRVL